MSQNEAHTRIKINKLLEEAGWRFFDCEAGKANILLENHVKITQPEVDAWGNDYELVKSGSLDFLLVDTANKQLIELFEQKIKDRFAMVWGVEKAGKEQELHKAAEPEVKYNKQKK